MKQNICLGTSSHTNIINAHQYINIKNKNRFVNIFIFIYTYILIDARVYTCLYVNIHKSI